MVPAPGTRNPSLRDCSMHDCYRQPVALSRRLVGIFSGAIVLFLFPYARSVIKSLSDHEIVGNIVLRAIW